MLASSGLGFTGQPFDLSAVYRRGDSRRPLSTDMCSLVIRLIYSAQPFAVLVVYREGAQSPMLAWFPVKHGFTAVGAVTSRGKQFVSMAHYFTYVVYLRFSILPKLHENPLNSQAFSNVFAFC